MSSYTVQLPCVSHFECAYHKHWRKHEKDDSRTENLDEEGPSDDSYGVSTRHHISAERASLPAHHESAFESTAGPFQYLPTELLLTVASFLPIIDQASLAVTCRSFAIELGPSAWKGASRAKGASWYKHAIMLDLLQRDMDCDEHWRCNECHVLHRRRRTIRNEEPKRKSSSLSSLSGILRSPADSRTSNLRFGCSAGPLYTLSYAARMAVLDRHILGAPHGVCLNTLKCSGLRSYTLSRTANMQLQYTIAPKIVVDCLLLHSKYTFTPQRTMFIRNMKICEIPTQEFLVNLDFWICSHQRTGDVMKSVPKDPKRAFSGPLRCPYCPTQYKAIHESQNSISLLVWQNLGSRPSANDSKWQALCQRNKKTKNYKWGQEDLGEAYRRILCSTREEYDRQVRRSDGRGNWYEPELEMNGYMTLPLKIADRLS